MFYYLIIGKKCGIYPCSSTWKFLAFRGVRDLRYSFYIYNLLCRMPDHSFVLVLYYIISIYTRGAGGRLFPGELYYVICVCFVLVGSVLLVKLRTVL